MISMAEVAISSAILRGIFPLARIHGVMVGTAEASATISEVKNVIDRQRHDWRFLGNGHLRG